MWPTTEKSNGDEKACKVMQVKNETQTGLAAEIKIVFRFSPARSEEHTSELQSRSDLVCRLLLEKKKKKKYNHKINEHRMRQTLKHKLQIYVHPKDESNLQIADRRHGQRGCAPRHGTAAGVSTVA